MIKQIRTVNEIVSETGSAMYVNARTEEIVDKVNELINVINNLNVLVEKASMYDDLCK